MAFFVPVHVPDVPERLDDPLWISTEPRMTDSEALPDLEAESNRVFKDILHMWNTRPALGSKAQPGDLDEDEEEEEEDLDEEEYDSGAEGDDEVDELDPADFVDDQTPNSDVDAP